ncbi:phenylalanyl-tRNA synthetase (alpha subunit) [Petrocella atlantisensis]|uniref:Phenylalanine--tRNA ligase alpha subunit n=1 Tax=Petrocella atlantisensis TaxID=2173034 RepID=A0A3P7PIQ0_9FIRM|nr:phenylalanine--tRNA ligase subunit alpha [Petrocella atlantisensis]VDN48808.1 phenylalanyl-tRNA synthetase (alpha subunit) [Petrocella atlantisensis]
MKEQLEAIKIKVVRNLDNIANLKALEEVRVNILGKKGELTSILKGMKDVAPEDRPTIGALVNEVRTDIEAALENAKNNLASKAREQQLKEEVIDVTMPSNKKVLGHRHPMHIVLEDLKNIFIGMGYQIAKGPEIEEDYYNFKALNIPEDHPARDEQDTFYIDKNFVLRTSTSPTQVHVMEHEKPPIRVIAPGRVYRSDEVDATHSPMFHQVEGLVIDENITMADLKGALAEFVKELYGEDAKVRFRPHYFPFTEPSAEVDVSCFKCGGTGCNICKGSGWIEILGCGMVHPKVLEMSGIDPTKYSGFAFGMGLERITMLRYGIEDLRLFYENDIRFLKQF